KSIGRAAGGGSCAITATERANHRATGITEESSPQSHRDHRDVRHRDTGAQRLVIVSHRVTEVTEAGGTRPEKIPVLSVSLWRTSFFLCVLCASVAKPLCGRSGRGPRIRDLLVLRIPVESLPLPVGLCGHHAGDRVREALVHRGVRLLAAAEALEP